MEQQISADIQPLNGMNENQFEEFLLLAFSLLGGSGSGEFVAKLEQYCEKHGVVLGAVSNCVRGTLLFFRDALRKNSAVSAIQEELVQLGLGADKAMLASTVWKREYAQLIRGVSGQSLSVQRLVDLEWKFGITSSSSELMRLGSTFLQLKLTLDSGSGSPKSYPMELSLEQFFEFVHEMEKARSALAIV